MKLVVVVDNGEWGQMRRAEGDYDVFTDFVRKMFSGRGKEDEGQAMVVADTPEALDAIASWTSDSDAVVVYITRGMLAEARRLKETHPDIRVVVLTGASDDLREPDLVIVEKGGLNYEILDQAILG